MQDKIVEILRCLLAEFTKPAPLYFSIDQFGDNMARFKVRVLLPATRPADRVTSREVTITTNGGQPQVQTVAPDAGQFDFFGNEGDSVSVSLVDLDQAGNRSAARNGTTTITDTIPPQQPGELAFTTIEEVEDMPIPPA